MVNNLEQKIVLAQDCETPIRVFRGKYFKCRYAYARSADTQAANDIGQDYLTFVQKGNSIVFALCDGVSLSFFGNLAAQMLGEILAQWLMTDIPDTLEKKKISGALNQLLLSAIIPATETVQDYTLPHNIPGMLRAVLEEKRAKGSESTFVCGRLDAPCKTFPAGRVVLAWLGDSRLRLWGTAGELSGGLGGAFETAQRWSTLHGPVGKQPHLFVAPLEGDQELIRFTAYTDGLASLDSCANLLSNSDVQNLITSTFALPTSDDIAYIEILPMDYEWPKSPRI